MTKFLQENFQNPDGVIGALTKHHEGALPQRAAVVKWFRRGSIPCHWVFILLETVRRETGVYPNLSEYLGGEGVDIFS